MNRRLVVIILSLAGTTAGLGCAAAKPAARPVAHNDYAPTIEKLIPGMGAAAIPARKDSQLEFEKLCHEVAVPGKDAERAAFVEAAIEKAGPATPKPARVWILRRVDTIGREEAVPGLVAIMKELDPEIRDLARRALTNNPSPQAAAALRSALAASAQDVEWKVSLINALGWRRDVESVPAIAKLAASRETSVARAAVSALGDIANPAAAKALAGQRKSAKADLRPAVIDASLHAADRLRISGNASAAASIFEELTAESEPEHTRVAAITGLAAAKGAGAVPALVKYVNGDNDHLGLIAARCLQRMDKSATSAIVKAMEAAKPETKALLLEVLGEHGDTAALKAVAKQATAENADVRLAALGAIGKLGDSSMVSLLIERGTKGEGAERDAARSAMASLHGKDVDGIVAERLGKAAGTERVELLYAAWGRRVAAAKPAVLESAKSTEEPARVAALTALERLAKAEDLPALVGLLVEAPNDTTRKLAEEAIGSVCRRAGDDERCSKDLAAAMQNATPEGKVALIRLLTKMQSQAGLPVIRAATKSDDATVAQAASAALKEWKPVQITAWTFSGPYRQEGKGPQDLFDIAFPPEEADGSAKWKPLKVNRRGEPSASIDLQKVAQGENCCAYCRVTIRSEREQAVVLTLGSDDGVKVWLNGQVVHAKNATRAANCDEDSAKATLKAGENVLLVKVTQGGGEWSFCCRIGSAEGGPADGLNFEAK